VLEPGSTIRLITGYEELEPEVEAAQATIEIISNEVGKSFQRGEWVDAVTGDELKPNDGVKTQASSSAVLTFDATSRVQMTENTQIFLSEQEKKDNGITRNEIEIEKGEAELKLDSANASDITNEFEIMIGEVRTSPSLSADGKASTKARLGDNDASQIMVYAGESAVESGGISVPVETGMGTTAKSGEAPSPPEKLLLAPDITVGNPTEGTPSSNQLAWNALDGAASYRFELCEDQACGQVIRIQKQLKTPTAVVNNLPEGQFYWRALAVSESGLDGFPSPAQSLIINQAPKPAPEPEPESKGLPWYIWAIFILYILYFLRIFTWHAYN